MLFVKTGTAGPQGLQCKPDTFIGSGKKPYKCRHPPEPAHTAGEHPASTVGTGTGRKFSSLLQKTIFHRGPSAFPARQEEI